MKLLKIALIFIAIFVSACDKHKLKKIENLATKYKECLANRIMMDECEDIKRDLKFATLEADRDGIDKKVSKLA